MAPAHWGLGRDAQGHGRCSGDREEGVGFGIQSCCLAKEPSCGASLHCRCSLSCRCCPFFGIPHARHSAKLQGKPSNALERHELPAPRQEGRETEKEKRTHYMLINDLKMNLDSDKKYIFLCSFTREFYDLLTQANLHFCNLRWISGNALEFYSH